MFIKNPKFYGVSFHVRAIYARTISVLISLFYSFQTAGLIFSTWAWLKTRVIGIWGDYGRLIDLGLLSEKGEFLNKILDGIPPIFSELMKLTICQF